MRDQADLRNWVLLECRVAPATTFATAASMTMTGGFAAGSIGTLQGDLSTKQIGLQNRQAGTYLDYGRFAMIG